MADWKTRTVLSIPPAQLTKLKQNRHAQIVYRNHYYELVPRDKTMLVIGRRKYKVDNGKLEKIKRILKGGEHE